MQSLVFPYQLITPPVTDTSLFPTGFPAGMHPVVVSTGYQNDIRMLNLDIKALFSGGVAVPYVDYLGDKKTPFNFLVQGYIGGINGNDLEAVVPSMHILSPSPLRPRTLSSLPPKSPTPIF